MTLQPQCLGGDTTKQLPVAAPEGIRGLTLLEVIITLAIMSTLMITVAQLMRQNFDIRTALSESNHITQAFNRTLFKVSTDLAHAFIIDSRITMRNDPSRRRTIFRIERSLGEQSQLSMTYLGHEVTSPDAKESELSYVVYEVRASEKFPNRRHLFRGEFPRVPQNFREKPPMQIFLPNVHTFRLETWTGDRWSTEGWDSQRGDMNNRLPHMVRVTLKVWETPADSGDESDEANLREVTTVVYIPAAVNSRELKQRVGTFRMGATTSE